MWCVSYILTKRSASFGIVENDCFGCLEHTDYQYLHYSQFVSTSTGKEKDSETGYYAFGARYYDCDLSGLFLSVDPMADKYPSLSPYNYCAWNPVKLVDPDGGVVIAADKQSQSNIIHSLSKAEAKYVRFDKKGNINLKRLIKCKSNSTNINALKTLALSKTDYIFSVETHHNDIYNDIDLSDPYGTSVGEHVKGVTLMPENANDPSPDNSVYIITSSNMSEEDQVANIAHEGYGHAYIYELKQQGLNVNPNHDYQPTIIGFNWDEETHFNVPILGRYDANDILNKQIEAAVLEAKQNYQSWTE